MGKDIIYREDAIEALKGRGNILHDAYTAVAIIRSIPSADRPTEVIYGNEHNCIMTIFGECSYAETGCGDCTVVEKVRKALSTDRPQGEWIKFGLGRGTRILFCTNCERRIEMPLSRGDSNYDYCPNCGARMKGADND